MFLVTTSTIKHQSRQFVWTFKNRYEIAKISSTYEQSFTFKNNIDVTFMPLLKSRFALSSISFMLVVSHLEKITLAFVQLLKKNLFALFFGQNTFLYMAFIVIYLQNCHLNFGNMQDCAILDNKILLFKIEQYKKSNKQIWC